MFSAVSRTGRWWDRTHSVRIQMTSLICYYLPKAPLTLQFYLRSFAIFCDHLRSFYDLLYLTLRYANISYGELGAICSHCHSEHCIATSRHCSATYLLICLLILLSSIYRILVTQHPRDLTKPIAHVIWALPHWSDTLYHIATGPIEKNPVTFAISLVFTRSPYTTTKET